MNFNSIIHTKSFKGNNVKKKISVIVLMGICHIDNKLELFITFAGKLKGTG